MQPGVVVVGGGQAGLEAAAVLRTQGYEGTVTLICEERHAPYQRPPLSKEFLTGKQEIDRAAGRVDGPVQVGPLALHPNIRLIHPPGGSGAKF